MAPQFLREPRGKVYTDPDSFFMKQFWPFHVHLVIEMAEKSMIFFFTHFFSVDLIPAEHRFRQASKIKNQKRQYNILKKSIGLAGHLTST
jgi:hypothetical protein